MKTSDLIDLSLDWAVTVALKLDLAQNGMNAINVFLGARVGGHHRYSTEWSQGGPIIDDEGISLIRVEDDYGVDSKGFTTRRRIPVWGAAIGQHRTYTSHEGQRYTPQYEISSSEVTHGPTALIAAMRCFVASKLGDDIEIPKELL